MKGKSFDRILSQMYPAYTSTPFFKIHFNIIIPSMSRRVLFTSIEITRTVEAFSEMILPSVGFGQECDYFDGKDSMKQTKKFSAGTFGDKTILTIVI
jgi:hypothetical protein